MGVVDRIVNKEQLVLHSQLFKSITLMAKCCFLKKICKYTYKRKHRVERLTNRQKREWGDKKSGEKIYTFSK